MSPLDKVSTRLYIHSSSDIHVRGYLPCSSMAQPHYTMLVPVRRNQGRVI
jgi:hypothetical protein